MRNAIGHTPAELDNRFSDLATLPAPAPETGVCPFKGNHVNGNKCPVANHHSH